MRKPKPIDTSSAEIAVTSESLGSVVVAGVAHAAYPTALSALCGLRRAAGEVDHEGPAPDCSECEMAATACAAIDDSAPKHWNLTSA